MKLLHHGLGCECRKRTFGGLCRVPPSPKVISALYMKYLRETKKEISFACYLESIGFVDPSPETNGMDDRVLAQPSAEGGLELIQIPEIAVSGQLQIIVLLLDFEDRKGYMDPNHYNDLLFSRNTHPTGSLADYYDEVSNGKVEILGSVHGWLRMPQTYEYYVGNESGMGKTSYPQSCKRLAEDAATVALENGIKFATGLDKLGRGFVTALFLVHAGRGAEHIQDPKKAKKEIWSHKWTVENPIKVASSGMSVTTYLTVPQDCAMGVCAHELGHLAFQWQDFYDPNYNKDGQFWQGTGDWDLMASGAHNYGGAKPAHPAGLHLAQHKWVAIDEVKESTENVTIKPLTANGGRVVKVRSNAFADGQYLLLENRQRVGFDKYIPGEGLLVWRVDESKEMYAPATPGMQLVQADGFQQLESPTVNNQGDDSDPFPGSKGVTELLENGRVSTSFPGGNFSGIHISNIRTGDAGVISLSIRIDNEASGSPSQNQHSAGATENAYFGPTSNAKPKPTLTKARTSSDNRKHPHEEHALSPRTVVASATKATKSIK